MFAAVGARGLEEMPRARPSPSAEPTAPGFSSQRSLAWGWGELVVAACPSPCVPGLLAASAPPRHQAWLGTRD